MADKKLFFLLGVLLFGLWQVSAQDFYIHRTEEGAVIIQRLSWEHSEFASRYVVVVQMLEQNGNYTEIEHADTEDNFAEFSLSAGSYRYRIEVYDLLDKFAFSTNWYELNIIRAYQPEITAFSPQSFYLDEDYNWVINLRGRYLFPESEIYLLQSDALLFSTRIHPDSFIVEGDTARLEFKSASLIPGEYNIYVRNPGGLDDEIGTFIIAFRKAVDINISLGYTPIVPLYGHFFKNTYDFKAPFSDSIYLLSGGIKTAVFPYKRTWGFFGAEFTGSFSFIDHDTEHYITQAFLLNTHISFIFQKYFFKRNLAFNIGLGGGLTGLMDFHYKYKIGAVSESITSFYPSVYFGTSLMIFFRKPFYIQPGFDFIHVITSESDRPMPGFARPFLNLGIRF